MKCSKASAKKCIEFLNWFGAFAVQEKVVASGGIFPPCFMEI